MLIKIQRGKEGMNHSKHHKELGATTACNKRMMEATKGVGQKSIKGGQKIVSFLIVDLPPRRRQKLQCRLVPSLLVW